MAGAGFHREFLASGSCCRHGIAFAFKSALAGRLPCYSTRGRVADSATSKPRLVVVGNGMAGMRTVEELLKLAPDLYQITVIGAEPHGNYNRIQLSPVLAGEIDISDIMLNDFAWYQANHIELISGTSVTRIDRLKRQVITAQGQAISYDRLLLALGSSPFVPDLPGIELAGVVSYRDIARRQPDDQGVIGNISAQWSSAEVCSALKLQPG